MAVIMIITLRKHIAHDAKTVGSESNFTGIIGCAALLSHHTKNIKMTRESNTVVRGSGCVHGKMLPAVLNPNNKNTTYATVSKTPG